MGLMIVGVPIKYGQRYIGEEMSPYTSSGAEDTQDKVEGQPTGRLCYDVVVPGLNKHLVLAYLLRSGVIARGRTLVIADSPSGNDEGLTKFHNHGIPFISVCKDVHKVPKDLSSCHVGGNAVGSSAALEVVAEWMKAEKEHQELKAKGTLVVVFTSVLRPSQCARRCIVSLCG